MKKIIYILIVSTLMIVSCDEVLDKEPLGIISDATVWNDQVLIDAFLTQCYIEMYVFDNENPSKMDGNGLWQGMYMINSISDESKAFATWSGNAYKFKFGNLLISGGLLEWWETPYKTIRRLNEFIERIADAPIEASFAKQRVAEARFLRAFNYFSMVKRYGGVPLITKLQNLNDPEEILFPKRATEQEIYDFIISEMDAIVIDLPETYSSTDYGRPTRYAALALKCRAALYAGSIAQFGQVQLDGVVGINNSLTNSYYEKSFGAAQEIINSNKHALYNKDANKTTNFRNVFMVERNSEAIFVRQHDNVAKNTGGNGSNYDFFQQPSPNGWGDGNADNPYLEMVEEFEYADGKPGTLNRAEIQKGLWTTQELWANRDPRFYATIYTQDTPWKGTVVDLHQGIITTEGTTVNTGSYNGILARGPQGGRAGFGVLKYLDESKNNKTDNLSTKTDWIVFRYAEILLNYAEAAFELGKTSDALNAVNQIRERAGIALLSNIDREKIHHERKVELAFEGHRYWDLRRWRIATTALTRDFSGLRYVLDYRTKKFQLIVMPQIDGSVNTPAFYERNYYFPITLARTGNNPNLVENPGYE
ncbi:MAG: hypothetical protein A2W90_09210 [Bacteroidetes bacterium GWF2_42_66]|nr:MAG: hypothetical protein A2W92_12185 [Bacteroidetes bacterium GWA2_42_15]OFY00585.1 MAG: hypothetical protein A2W89_20525 [Bacteroidetes bacterium GWE2_42_39]OFY42319.1 MAG: hypothetical protein A2W90_09210 [Bacteroidetes bacterium GWF2_42_66]HAZ02073.1 RagB/SusD family nutrient uptake outer membrane protein [Marinilabiliales bacterium]HBL76473.1 RagB/SusD family nutrient uptake outer membrane protein [Prolixibacteraceae bacterium]